jgi:peptidyl-prolyl cis-trans isomerase A (cyclophilin A)
MFKKLFISLALLLVAASTVFAAGEPGKNPVVVMETTLGNVKIELFQKEAPISVKNFLDYANSGYYAGTVFHRVIPGFMAQGGGLTAELQPKPGARPSIKNEADNNLKNDRGTLAMARTSDPNSATSQFFINVNNNSGLNRPSPDGAGYAVFGKVIDGMDVVDKIVSTPQERKNGVFQNVPITPVLIKSVKVQK